MLFGDSEIAAELKAISGEPRGRGLFFNEKMELNQGAYLTEVIPRLMRALQDAYRKSTGLELPLAHVSQPAEFPLRELEPTPRLSGNDISLLRQSRMQKRYADLTAEQRDVYRRVDHILRFLGETARQSIGSPRDFGIKLTSGFHPEGGIRGTIPKDLWFGVYNLANVPEFVGMPQVFAIISGRGVEYGFAPAIHPKDFSQQAIKDKVREAAPKIFARLPQSNSPLAQELGHEIMESGRWQFQKKTRLDPGSGEYSSLRAWLEFLKSEQGQKWAGGSISRYVSEAELDDPNFSLPAAIRDAALLFKSLMIGITPNSKAEEPPKPNPDLDDTVPRANVGIASTIPAEQRPPYPIEQALDGLFIEPFEFQRWLDIWRDKRNLVIQGAPGVGKSFIARRLAYALIGFDDPTRVRMVQFHQSYSYEDFVQGFRPEQDGGFKLRDGAFVEFCRRAISDPDETYVFIIDEINRGNLSKILGEMMLLIEPDKRDPNWATRLAYSSPERHQGDPKQQPFYVP